MFDIKENLKKLPDCPGVYLHKDKLGQVIYVGKAISLKNRVRQYFQSPKNQAPKVRAMVANIEEFEYITCASEMEALILECNLIKKYAPKYNILLRDDKTYPYIKVTVAEPYPRVVKTRRIEKDGAKYFGPYSDEGAVNVIIDMLNRRYTLKRCSSREFPKDFRPCLNYHIKQCRGICTGEVSEEDYGKQIRDVLDFLEGKDKKLERELEAKMKAASDALNFEEAARLRDELADIASIREKQRVTVPGMNDLDIVLAAQTSAEDFAIVFFVRDGKLSGRETFPLQLEGGGGPLDIVDAFIKQYYGDMASVPREILVEALPEDVDLLERYLEGQRGSQVKIYVPQRGDKKALLDLAKRDRLQLTDGLQEKADNKRERENALESEISAILAEWAKAHKKPARTKTEGREAYLAEAYDISNTNGIDTVGAMVVFLGSRPMKKAYRRFKIRTDSADDYGSLQEVMYRRFKRMQEGDPGFSTMPDILFIDGGKGQVSAVETVLSAMKIDVPVIGMAKDDHHRTRAFVWSKPHDEAEGFAELPLAEHPLLFKYAGVMQEEVHRFVIDYHRGLRSRKMRGSLLDEIPGIGPVKRNALLADFGSIAKIKEASAEEIAKVEGFNLSLAEAVLAYLHKGEEK